MLSRRRCRCLLLLLAAAAPGAGRAAEVDVEAALRKVLGTRHWYGIYMQGRKSGYALMETAAAKAGERDAVEATIRIRVLTTTLGKQQDMRVTERRVYLRTGPLHSAATRLRTGPSDIEVSALVEGGKLLLTAQVGALRSHKELPAPTESLRDAFAADALARPEAKIGDTVRVRQFEPILHKELDAVLTLTGRRTITYNGVPTRVSVIQLKVPALGVSSDTYVDERGTALELTVAQMFVLRLEPERQAKDIRYSSDLIRMGCVRLHPHPAKAGSLRRLRVRIAGIDDPQLLVNDARQTWTRQPDGSHVVAVRVPRVDAAGAARRPVDRTRFPHELAATYLVQCDDPRVRQLAARLVGDERNSYEAARKINHWLHRRLRKVGTATLSNAAETLEAMEGDCTEHTVLFVALARAAGIPAREVSGVTAIERGEGLYYHAWPEVWVGQWVAMDPTLGQDVADATHIKFGQGGLEQLFRIAGLFGRIEAKVVDDAPRPPAPEP